MNHDEDKIVRPAVIDYLRDKGHWVVPHETKARLRSAGGKIFHEKDEKGYFRTPGESDLLVFHKDNPAFPIWIELKKPGKHKIDPKQGVFKKRAECMGHESYAVNCVQDCIDLGF